ncbi:MAG: aminotransferase class V-fold PLP-dependent enzyme [Gemmatimonadales bacterium]
MPVPKLAPAPDEAPERLETGTLSHEAITGVHAAVDYLAGIVGGPDRRTALLASYAELHRRAHELFGALWDGLGSIPGVTRFGVVPDRPRTPTAGFTLAGVASSEVARRLAERGVFVSHGDFYAATVVERLRLGPEGLVRAGAACYTDRSDVDRLLEGVAALAR